MISPLTHLTWLDDKRPEMERLLVELCNINSGTFNLKGLALVKQKLLKEFSQLNCQTNLLPLEPFQQIDSNGKLFQQQLGDAVQFIKRPEAPIQIFLCIHMDTVYSATDPFQVCELIDPDTLRGPGVADAKGGIVVMLYALKCLEASELASQIGWEVIINPDEEIGSPGTAKIFSERAPKFDFGLLFEPAYPDGSLVDQRKGSGNFTFVINGKAAHAGREFSKGKNAIVKGAELVKQIDELNGQIPEVTLNVGKIEGGDALNVVPDLAIVRVNVRIVEAAQIDWVEEQFKKIVQEIDQQNGFTCTQYGHLSSPPKILDPKTNAMQTEIGECCQELGIEVRWTATGGACDGNRLAAAGLSNLDTLGVVGGNIHSDQEYVLLNSLVPRAKLTALMLLKQTLGKL